MAATTSLRVPKPVRRADVIKSLLVVIVIVFLVTQVLEFFFQVNYNAVPTFFLNQLSPSGSVSTKELMTEDRRRFYANRRNSRDSFLSSFPRYSCGCDNYNEVNKNVTSSISTFSTCSLEASFYSNQKVISYSLYVEDNDGRTFFLEGIGPNLDKIKQIFPGWNVRIYTNIPINNYSCDFICNYTFLYWCDIGKVPKLGNLSGMNIRVWRYLTLGDPTVDLFLSRDLDSTASERERYAVTEWENSNKSIHVIRDSHWHETEVLAGLWGFKNHAFSKKELDDLQTSIIRVGDRSSGKFWDQEIVKNYIYFPFKDRVLAHDSYFCGKYPDGLVRPFPIQRIGQEFVGHDDRKEMNRLMIGKLKTCPKECRPQYGQEWTYC